jgi:cytochrome b561
MKNKHYILVALILLIGGFILFFLRQVLFDNGLIRGMAFSAAIVAGILILIIAVIRLVISVIRKSRGKMTNNDSENQPAFKGLPTAIVFVFFRYSSRSRRSAVISRSGNRA